MARRGSQAGGGMGLLCGAGLLLLASLVSPGAQADVYVREGHRFEIPGLTLLQVQNAVVSSMGFFVDGLHPYWDGTLCYDILGGNDSEIGQVTDLYTVLNARLAARIDRCGSGGGGPLAYYFKHGEVGGADRNRLLALAGNAEATDSALAKVLDGKGACGAGFGFKAGDWRKVIIRSAAVAVDETGLDKADREKCLFLTTVSILGLGSPARLPDSDAVEDDWQRIVEFNLLALFVLRVVAEDQRGWDREALEAKVRSVLLVMHELGKN